jgi:hypothetical protein
VTEAVAVPGAVIALISVALFEYFLFDYFTLDDFTLRREQDGPGLQ